MLIPSHVWIAIGPSNFLTFIGGNCMIQKSFKWLEALWLLKMTIDFCFRKVYKWGFKSEVEKVVNPVNLVDRKYSYTQSLAENTSKILK